MADTETTPTGLPAYAPGDLAQYDTEQLVNLLIADKDRAPRALVDECARRGEDMVPVLVRLVRDNAFWKADVERDMWWLGLHTVMILGLIPGESAGRLLVDIMRRMDEADDLDMQDWCAGYWPALFRNKPDTVLPALQDLSMDRSLDWYLRANAMEPVIAAADRQDPAALDSALDWLAGMAADEKEDWEARLTAAHLLIEFPRARHRPLLESLAAAQEGIEVRDFSLEEIETAYAAGKDDPQWLRFADPWKFYSPDAIAERQARREEEDADLLIAQTPLTRAAPKIGRNELCPCGSGRKYKKCCLSLDDAAI